MAKTTAQLLVVKTRLSTQLGTLEADTEVKIVKLIDAHAEKIELLNVANDGKIKATRDGIQGRKEKIELQLIDVATELSENKATLIAQIEEIKALEDAQIEVDAEVELPIFDEEDEDLA